MPQNSLEEPSITIDGPCWKIQLLSAMFEFNNSGAYITHGAQPWKFATCQFLALNREQGTGVSNVRYFSYMWDVGRAE